MSEQKWKLVPVEPDEIHQMAFEEGQPAENGDGYLFTTEEFDLFAQRLIDRVAATQPPALGGEPEVLAYQFDYSTRTNDPREWGFVLDKRAPHPDLIEEGRVKDIVELVDRAHVARLQAEVERLKGRPVTGVKEEVFDIVCKERDGAYARTAELEGLLREAVDEMDDFITSELSKRIRAALRRGQRA